MELFVYADYSTPFFKSIFRTLHMDDLLAIEKNLHTPFEELTETTAHLFFLLLAIVCFTLSKQKKPL